MKDRQLICDTAPKISGRASYQPITHPCHLSFFPRIFTRRLFGRFTKTDVRLTLHTFLNRHYSQWLPYSRLHLNARKPLSQAELENSKMSMLFQRTLGVFECNFLIKLLGSLREVQYRYRSPTRQSKI